jgi:hypothetical protein
MAKTGLRNNTPANGNSSITGAELKRQMKRQAAPLKSAAFAESIKTSDKPNERKWEWTYINGTKVKRYLD